MMIASRIKRSDTKGLHIFLGATVLALLFLVILSNLALRVVVRHSLNATLLPLMVQQGEYVHLPPPPSVRPRESFDTSGQKTVVASLRLTPIQTNTNRPSSSAPLGSDELTDTDIQAYNNAVALFGAGNITGFAEISRTDAGQRPPNSARTGFSRARAAAESWTLSRLYANFSNVPDDLPADASPSQPPEHLPERLTHSFPRPPFIDVAFTWWGSLEPKAYAAIPAAEPSRQGASVPDDLVTGSIGDTGSNHQNDTTRGTALQVPATAYLFQLNARHTFSSYTSVAWIGSLLIGLCCMFIITLTAVAFWLRTRKRLKSNSNIEYLAHHDPLTSLPNRMVFSAFLNEALRSSEMLGLNLCVMLLDVDKFKSINDTYGHGVGDVYLQIIASRLQSVFEGHLVSRLSGDEFAVIVTALKDAAPATELAQNLMRELKEPCKIDGQEIQISISAGLALATFANWDASRVLRCSDLALYEAKHAGRSTFCWYSPTMDEDARKRKEIEAGLVYALENDEFELLYQPQFALKDNTLQGYEALIRWHPAGKGSISPSVFITIAEDCGLISDIGAWVLNKACHEAASWPDKNLTVAVNLSPAQFKPHEITKKIAQALAHSHLDPSRLEIEITETILLSNTEEAIDTLNEIRRLGVRIAMDNFGTGYSSLTYLHRFPFDKIKVDRSFIRDLGKDLTTDVIVSSIIGIGRSMGIPIVAEGVENQNQVTLLRATGCSMVQGYLYGRPGSISSERGFQPHVPGAVALNKHQTSQKIAEQAAVSTVAHSDVSIAEDRHTTRFPAREDKSSDHQAVPQHTPA